MTPRGIGIGRTFTVALCAVALSVTAITPSGASTAQSSALPRTVAGAVAASSVAWTACGDGFQCATVSVPLDYDQPAGPKISLSLIRLPAGSPSQRIGSLLLNPGGPGGSGVDMARFTAKFMPLELRARFDIVGFDPRGMARSTPLRCYDTLDQVVADLAPFPFPETPAEEQVQRVADEKLAAACVRHGGPILNHMSTADVARDMDFLRQTLGDAQLSYYGVSYGSILGQTYANLFPDKVRALVIDGVLDPIDWTTGHGAQATTRPFTYRIRAHLGANKTFAEFLRLCDAAGSDCAFSGNARQRFNALAARLRVNPVDAIDPRTGQLTTFTYNVLISLLAHALYAPIVWPDLAVVFADLEGRAAPATLGKQLAAVRTGMGMDTAQEPYPNFVDGPPGVACADSVNPGTFAAWPNTADVATSQSRYFGRIWTWTSSVCASWPRMVAPDRYLGPWTARTARPVLIVGNYFDPSTRYEGAVAASRLLPNSRLLSYAGWGHTVAFLGISFCIDDAVTRYLVTTRTPPAGTVCQPEGSPFGPSEAPSAAQRQVAAARAAAILPRSGG